MITFSNVTKKFGNFTALDNINFEIPNGSTVALVGGNGCGKTTLLRIISTLLKPTVGKATVGGIDVLENPSAVRKKIGLMLGGDASLFSHLTAYENIEYFAKLNNSSAPKKRIGEVTELLGMQDYINKPVGGFSRGMRQKVIFASSTIHNPEIILLDEPSTGLDIFAINEVHDLIKTYKTEGKTVIISSHNMDEVKKIADNVIIMNQGRIMQYDALEKLFDRYGTHSLDRIFKEVIKEEAEVMA